MHIVQSVTLFVASCCCALAVVVTLTGCSGSVNDPRPGISDSAVSDQDTWDPTETSSLEPGIIHSFSAGKDVGHLVDRSKYGLFAVIDSSIQPHVRWTRLVDALSLTPVFVQRMIDESRGANSLHNTYIDGRTERGISASIFERVVRAQWKVNDKKVPIDLKDMFADLDQHLLRSQDSENKVPGLIKHAVLESELIPLVKYINWIFTGDAVSKVPIEFLPITNLVKLRGGIPHDIGHGTEYLTVVIVSRRSYFQMTRETQLPPGEITLRNEMLYTLAGMIMMKGRVVESYYRGAWDDSVVLHLDHENRLYIQTENDIASKFQPVIDADKIEFVLIYAKKV